MDDFGRTRACHRSYACMASCRVTLRDDEPPRGGDVIHRFLVGLSGFEVSQAAPRRE